jgi:hypothetical protein
VISVEDTIHSIQRDEAHSQFMLERLYNQVCSKCVHHVLDLSYRRALSTTSTALQSPLLTPPSPCSPPLSPVHHHLRLVHRRTRRATLTSSSRRPRRPVTLADPLPCRPAALADPLPCRPAALTYAPPPDCPHRHFAAAPADERCVAQSFGCGR